MERRGSVELKGEDRPTNVVNTLTRRRYRRRRVVVQVELVDAAAAVFIFLFNFAILPRKNTTLIQHLYVMTV